MKINNLTFIVTDDCNFNCSYCFQKKEKNKISDKIIDKAVDFFYPFLESKNRVHIGFYGGEPLLAFDEIKYTVKRLQEKNSKEDKKLGFSLTSNGSLLTGEMLEFFNNNRFSLMLSFDGLAQDIGRKQGTFEKIAPLIKRILSYPGIDFEINSVFSPRTVSLFFDSLRYIIELEKSELQRFYNEKFLELSEPFFKKVLTRRRQKNKVILTPQVNFDLDGSEEWQPDDIKTLKKELAKLVDYLALYYKETGQIPVKNFQGVTAGPGPGIFRCSAGRDHMAVAPNGDVWGCFLFHDFFKRRTASAPYEGSGKHIPGHLDREVCVSSKVSRSINKNRRESPQHRDFYFGRIDDFAARYKTRYPEVKKNYADLRQDFFSVAGDSCFLCGDVRKCMVCPVSAAYASGSLGKVSCGLCSLNKIQMQAREAFHKKLENL